MAPHCLRAVVIAGCLLIAGCGNNPPPLPPVTSALLNPAGNFTLVVTNQSLSRSPIDIEIRIDDEVVVYDHFDVGTQHTYRSFTLLLSPGEHRVRVVSVRGEAEMTQDFAVTGRHYAEVCYAYAPWYSSTPYPAQLQWKVKDTPFQYD